MKRWKGKSEFGAHVHVDTFLGSNGVRYVELSINFDDILLSPATAKEIRKALRIAAREAKANQ